jgi:hypothetical protein
MLKKMRSVQKHTGKDLPEPMAEKPAVAAAVIKIHNSDRT